MTTAAASAPCINRRVEAVIAAVVAASSGCWCQPSAHRASAALKSESTDGFPSGEKGNDTSVRCRLTETQQRDQSLGWQDSAGSAVGFGRSVLGGLRYAPSGGCAGFGVANPEIGTGATAVSGANSRGTSRGRLLEPDVVGGECSMGAATGEVTTPVPAGCWIQRLRQ